MSEDACRIDVWLWRARFFKTRSLAAQAVETGRIRFSRAGQPGRVDKPSRTVRPGDGIVFALGGRLVAVRIEALGERRGPASEARALYADLEPTAGSIEAPLTSEPANSMCAPPVRTRRPSP